MQAPGQSQRSLQRRSPGPEPGPPPNVPIRSMSPAVGVGLAGPVQPRSSTASSRSTGSGTGGSTRRTTASSGGSSSSSTAPLSQIEKSVTHLLVATKSLLETLTQWSRGQATDTQVSDVYVRLGYEFNMACRAFTAINVDTSDLGNVPELLRNILEATLSQEASAESLEKYLPRIRDIIINLLHGLKRKQQKLRQKQARDRDTTPAPGGAGETTVGRTTSTSTMGSMNSGLTSLLNEGIENGYPNRPQDNAAAGGGAGRLNTSPERRFASQRDPSRASVNSEQSSLSSNTMQSIPVLPPYPSDDAAGGGGGGSIPGGPAGNDLSIDAFPPPPPPPPKSQQSALAALQRGGDLERRASRRYSAYQISKHLGSGPNGVPMLPPQNTPIPNRGRGEVRESMRAVQVRENLRHGRNQSRNAAAAAAAAATTTTAAAPAPIDTSPVRIPSRVTEERESVEPDLRAGGSPTAQTPDDKYPQPSATLRGPPVDVMPVMMMAGGEDEAKAAKAAKEAGGVGGGRSTPVAPPTPPEKEPSHGLLLEASPMPATKELTLFLQYKSKVKKFVLSEGYSDLTIGRLQLAFIEKFSWNTQQNGVDLPEIYIQDPVSGVRHELEDLSDIKDRTVLALNVEPLDEVKRHIDEGLGSIKKIVQEVKQNVDDHGAALQRVSDRQQETAKEMARLATAPPPPMTPPADSPRVTLGGGGGSGGGTRRFNGTAHVSEVQALRRDLAVLRQTYSTFQTDIQTSMAGLRSKAGNVKVAAAKAAVPDVEGGSGQAYVTKGRKQLNADSDRLVTKVDDLQDLVEDLRKDVVNRGVRPLPRQLEAVTKDITTLTKELRSMGDYMRREKPVWTKIWEKELEDVCQGRDELRLMEDLLVDLQDDLEKAAETFALVEQATKEQMKDTGATGGSVARQFSKGLRSIVADNTGVDPNAAKEGVLGEVRALQPNHENRLEAIERAEKLRQKELESRSDNPLKKELTHFVEEGKLKKSGGFEEVERARKAKDDRIRREVWERQNGIVSSEDGPPPLTPLAEEEAQAAEGGGGGES